MTARDRSSRGAKTRPHRAAGTSAPQPPATPVPFTHPAHLVALLLTLAVLLLAVSYLVYDPDQWQHLAVGRVIVETHAFPHTHLWSWPTYGAPDAPPSWLFRVILFGFWKLAGDAGVQAWRWCAVLAIFGLAISAARARICWPTEARSGFRPAQFAPLAVAVLAALIFRQRSQARPESLAAILLAAELLVLEGRRLQADRRFDLAWLLPLIQLAWANAHASWFLGPGLSLAYLVDDVLAARRGEPRRPGTLAAAIGLSLVATAIHPYGWAALREPFEYLFSKRAEQIYLGIGELRPVQWGGHLRDPLVPMLLLWPALLLWRPRGVRFDWAAALVCVIATAVALNSQRFLGLWSVAATAYIGRELASRRPPRALASPWARGVLASLVAVVAGLLVWTDPGRTIGVGVEHGSVPVAASDFIEHHGIRGRAFSPFNLGGWLAWRFHGERDRLGFMDVHQSGTVRDRDLYVRAFTSADAWRELDDERHFEWVLLDVRVPSPGVDLPDRLDADPAWALVFLDDGAALWLRRTGRTAALADSLALRLPAGAQGVAAMMATPGDSAETARRIATLERLVAASPEHRRAITMLAAFQLAAGRPDSAAAWVARARSEFGDDAYLARLDAALLGR